MVLSERWRFVADLDIVGRGQATKTAAEREPSAITRRAEDGCRRLPLLIYTSTVAFGIEIRLLNALLMRCAAKC